MQWKHGRRSCTTGISLFRLCVIPSVASAPGERGRDARSSSPRPPRSLAKLRMTDARASILLLLVHQLPLFDVHPSAGGAAARVADASALAFEDAVTARSAVGGFVVTLVRRVFLFVRRSASFGRVVDAVGFLVSHASMGSEGRAIIRACSRSTPTSLGSSPPCANGRRP